MSYKVIIFYFFLSENENMTEIKNLINNNNLTFLNKYYLLLYLGLIIKNYQTFEG